MRLIHEVDVSGIWPDGTPLVVGSYIEGAAQRSSFARRITKLGCEQRQAIIEPQVAPIALDLIVEQSGQCEVLKDGNDISEALMKGQHVAIARVHESAMHAVDNGMRRLVCHDVVGQTGENNGPRQLIARI